ISRPTSARRVATAANCAAGFSATLRACFSPIGPKPMTPMRICSVMKRVDIRRTTEIHPSSVVIRPGYDLLELCGVLFGHERRAGVNARRNFFGIARNGDHEPVDAKDTHVAGTLR